MKHNLDKYGSFVSSDAMDINRQDIEDFTARLKEYFSDFFVDVNVDNRTIDAVKSGTNDNANDGLSHVKCVFSMGYSQPVYGKNVFDEIICFKRICFILQHHSGECRLESEAIDGVKDLYMLTFKVDGKVIEPGSSRPGVIFPDAYAKTFQWKRSIEELEFEDIRDWFRKFIDVKKCTPNDYKTMVKKFTDDK